MENTPAFFTGFVVAGIIGWLSNLILRAWIRIVFWRGLIFVLPPQPALRPAYNPRHRTIGATPELAPLQVVGRGCILIFANFIFQISVIGVIFLLVQAVPAEVGSTQEFLTGIIFAAGAGFLLQQIVINWARITILFAQITNPPQPILRLTELPNDHHAAARPTGPACAIVFNNSAQILLRLIWQLVLVLLLILLVQAAIDYVQSGTIFPTPAVREFGT